MRDIRAVLVLLVVTCASLAWSFPQEKWTHKALLDEENEVVARWRNWEDEEGEKWITMEVSAKTKGYVGIGFSPKEVSLKSQGPGLTNPKV